MSARRIAALAVAVIMVGACGSAGSVAGGARPSPSGPQPTLTPPQLATYDAQLLIDLKAIDFQVFETDIMVGRYVMRNGGLDYDKKSFGVDYSGLVIDEWKAMAFNPDSGKCSTQYPQYTWNCSYLATSPRCHRIYASPSGGLNGYPPDLADVYVELATTVLNLKGATGNVPSLGDLEMMVDALNPVTPEEAVRRNQRARDNTQYLLDTAASRVDFKTYLPTAPLENFALDRKILDNPSDPMHPYLYLHFARVAIGNQAFEFTVDEFRDDVPLSAAHCGIYSPEIRLQERCAPWFTTARGVAVFASYSSTLFDRSPTRIVIHYSASIHGVTRAEMEPFVDSFAQVAATTIGPPTTATS